MYAKEPWELSGDFTIPCMFTYSGVVLDNGELLIGYGAADQKIGIATVPFDYILKAVKKQSCKP